MTNNQQPDHSGLSADLCWDLKIYVQPRKQEIGRISLHQADWVQALYHGGDDILPALLHTEIYHEKFDDLLEVGYAFEFRLDDNGRIKATGSIHPAESSGGMTATYTERTLAQADIILEPLDPVTAHAIRTYLKARENTQHLIA